MAIQYADYAVWQREWLQGEALERQMGYWRERLAGVEALELPTDYPRPAVQSYRGASRSFVIEPRVDGRSLRELASARGRDPVYGAAGRLRCVAEPV